MEYPEAKDGSRQCLQVTSKKVLGRFSPTCTSLNPVCAYLYLRCLQNFWFPQCRMLITSSLTCPSQKLIHGEYIVIHHPLCSDWMQFTRVWFIWTRQFQGELFDWDRFRAQIIRWLWRQNFLYYRAAFFHSYRWWNPPTRCKAIILHLPAGLGCTGRPPGVLFSRLKCVLSLW